MFDIAGYVLMSIPYFFWDYDDEKQNKVMEVLRRREEVTRKQMKEGDDSRPGIDDVENSAKDRVEVTS